MTRAVLVLEDGQVFTGRSYGADGSAFGEAVFSTGMTGYQETITDPSYCGQVVVQTAPHIGNTGWNDEDDESQQIWVSGYVVRDPARRPSNWRSTTSLDDELRKQNVAKSAILAASIGPSSPVSGPAETGMTPVASVSSETAFVSSGSSPRPLMSLP